MEEQLLLEKAIKQKISKGSGYLVPWAFCSIWNLEQK